MVNLVLRHVFTLQPFSVDAFKKTDIQTLIYLTKGSDNRVVGNICTKRLLRRQALVSVTAIPLSPRKPRRDVRLGGRTAL